jgi:hypothetical protein
VTDEELRDEFASLRKALEVADVWARPKSVREMVRGHGAGAVTIGEVEALHQAVDKLEAWRKEVDARLAALEGR